VTSDEELIAEAAEGSVTRCPPEFVRWRRKRGIPTGCIPAAYAAVLVAGGGPTAKDLMRLCERTGLHPMPTVGEAEGLLAAEQGRGGKLSHARLGKLVDLTTVERDEIKFWTAYAIDETPEDGRKRRAGERARHREADAGEAKARDRRARDAERKRTKRRDAQVRLRLPIIAAAVRISRPLRISRPQGSIRGIR
jgi:hypothetical protein